MAKQSKNSKQTILPPKPDFTEVEVDMFQEDLDDDLIKTLSSAKTDQITSIKEKERKVIEFKSRVLELVEIFLTNTRNPNIFIERMHPFIKMISDFKNPQKVQYINRICKLIHSIISKGDLAEHIDNMKQCCDTLIIYVHKCSDKQLNKRFIELLDILLKAVSQHNKKIVIETIIKGLSLMKKNSNIKSQEMRKLIFAYPFCLPQVIVKLCELSEINEHYDRSKYEFSNILLSLTQNEKLKQKILSKQNVVQYIEQLAESALQNYGQQKYKKVAVFRQIMLAYKSLSLNTLDVSEFKADDQNIQHIVDKLK